MNKKYIILIILLFISSLFLSAPSLNGRLKVNNNSLILAKIKERNIENRVNKIKSMDFNKELLIEYIRLVDPSLCDIPIKQFIIETGWFSSTLFLEYNNIAGMKYPLVRQTTAIGIQLEHASYNHWTDSVDDYIHWKNYWKFKGYDTSNYYKFLKDIGYATSENYNNLLRSINLKLLEESV